MDKSILDGVEYIFCIYAILDEVMKISVWRDAKQDIQSWQSQLFSCVGIHPEQTSEGHFYDKPLQKAN